MHNPSRLSCRGHKLVHLSPAVWEAEWVLSAQACPLWARYFHPTVFSFQEARGNSKRQSPPLALSGNKRAFTAGVRPTKPSLALSKQGFLKCRSPLSFARPVLPGSTRGCSCRLPSCALRLRWRNKEFDRNSIGLLTRPEFRLESLSRQTHGNE